MNPQGNSLKALTLSTLAFTISFALWGMISPMAKTFQTTMHLTEQQAWLLIAVPVILGSIMRLPMGMLADRFGGRIVFGALLMFSGLAALSLSFSNSYRDLLIGGLILGMAGTSFSVGVAFTSKWFGAEKQGLALGIYGAGNIGQSIALLAVPQLSQRLGWHEAYQIFAIVGFLYGVFFLMVARDAPVKVQPKSMGEMLMVRSKQPTAWVLALFYFVTFGGFVALSIGLPKLLQELFGLTRGDAGLRVAGFVLLATAMRPLGGWISDRFGGSRVLLIIFSAAAVLVLGMTSNSIVPFTIGALGTAACIGLGNGAVFKLVPQHFPKDTGTVTGLVGAIGGLGGFFPPIILGIIKSHTGSYALGFILLCWFCVLCAVMNYLVFLRREKSGRLAAAGANN